jgi:DnaD/phage-associated family protein
MKGYQIGNSAAVTKLATANITGNVIPLEWFNHIRRPNGKPYDIAIMLLSDIVYWHRPIEIRDEKTGKVTGYRKKFAADKLQRDYNGFSSLYGYTKNQVRDALAHLAEMGLIDLDWRHPVINGKQFGNVLYIGLDVDKVLEITYVPLPDLKQIGYQEINGDPLGFKADTNTETTTEITTDDLEEADPLPSVFRAYESEIGPLTPMNSEELQDLVEEHTAQWVIAAIKESSIRNKRSLGYCKAILKRWKVDGYGSEFKPASKNGNKKTTQPGETWDDVLKELREA